MFTGIKKFIMLRKIKRTINMHTKAACDAMMLAGEYNFSDPRRFEHEEKFMLEMDKRSHMEKVYTRINGQPLTHF